MSSIEDSATPPTSVTDAASDAAEEEKHEEGGRSRRVRANPVSYSEKALSAASRPVSRGKKAGKRVNDDATIVMAATLSEPERDLGRSIMDALDMDWSLPKEAHDPLVKGPTRRKSVRMDILEKATNMVEKTAVALGKRTRNTVDAGKDFVSDLSRRTSLRARTDAESQAAEPAKKKARLEQSKEEPEEEPPQPVRKFVVKRQKKLWLKQGLYVGQEPDFDPRLTNAKNLEKQKSLGTASQRKYLPLPMFAGARLLERDRDFKLPFDIFSPLPPGQPKPDEWRKTRRNHFVGDSAEHWRSKKLLEVSRCMCEEETGCDDDCLNRSMFYECDDTNCNLAGKQIGTAGHCGNRSFADLAVRTKTGGKFSIGVEVMRTVNRGFGVRSNRCFEPGQIIVEYTGEIITQAECDKRMHTMYKDNEVCAC
jgi:histone-lysine N-methyltransferase ASH1L